MVLILGLLPLARAFAPVAVPVAAASGPPAG
jgi:hypothetical protein